MSCDGINNVVKSSTAINKILDLDDDTVMVSMRHIRNQHSIEILERMLMTGLEENQLKNSIPDNIIQKSKEILLAMLELL
jgi:hypothetical protein